MVCRNTGIVGIALAKAGAKVIFTDLPHITPFTAANIERNRVSLQECQVAVCTFDQP